MKRTEDNRAPVVGVGEPAGQARSFYWLVWALTTLALTICAYGIWAAYL